MKIVRVNHVGVIIPRLDEALVGFRDLLGLQLDHVERYGSELDIAFLPCGDTQVELIEPLREGPSAAFLHERGPGIQHVAFEVADLEAALAELAERGVKPVGTAPRPGAGNTRIAFLDPAPFGGVLVELCEVLP